MLVLFGLTALAPMAIPSLLDWRRRRRQAREVDAVAAYFSAPKAPPTVEQRLQTALAQHLARAFTAWWRGLGAVCPGCGGRALSTDLSNERRVYAAGPIVTP